MHEKKFNIRVMVKYLLLISAFILGILYFRQVLYFLQRLWGILFPLILGAAIAYILNLIVRRLEKLYFPHAKKKFFLLTRRPICIALSLVLILGILVLIVTMIVPELIVLRTSLNVTKSALLLTISSAIASKPPFTTAPSCQMLN